MFSPKRLFNLANIRAGSYIASALILVSSPAWGVLLCHAQQTKKPFPVADEVGLTLFDEFDDNVRFSPDGKYFAVYGERGRLDANVVEDTLRFYRSQEVEDFLNQSDKSEMPSPIWVLKCSTEEGPIINGWRWLSDSSGVAFLERTAGGNKRLVLADLRTKRLEPLTSATEAIKEFDLRDRHHYVYTTADSAMSDKRGSEREASLIVGTGRG